VILEQHLEPDTDVPRLQNLARRPQRGGTGTSESVAVGDEDVEWNGKAAFHVQRQRRIVQLNQIQLLGGARVLLCKVVRKAAGSGNPVLELKPVPVERGHPASKGAGVRTRSTP